MVEKNEKDIDIDIEMCFLICILVATHFLLFLFILLLSDECDGLLLENKIIIPHGTYTLL